MYTDYINNNPGPKTAENCDEPGRGFFFLALCVLAKLHFSGFFFDVVNFWRDSCFGKGLLFFAVCVLAEFELGKYLRLPFFLDRYLIWARRLFVWNVGSNNRHNHLDNYDDDCRLCRESRIAASSTKNTKEDRKRQFFLPFFSCFSQEK